MMVNIVELHKIVHSLQALKEGRSVSIGAPINKLITAWPTATADWASNRNSPCEKCDINVKLGLECECVIGKRCALMDACVAHKRRDRKSVIFKFR